MLRQRLKEILRKKGVRNYRLWKDLKIDQGQLSNFFNGKKGISLKKLELIADFVGYKIVPVSKEEIKKDQLKKKRVDETEAAKIAAREIEESLEKFESTCPGFYVKAIDGPPVKLHVQKGTIGTVSTIGRNEPDSKQKSEKPGKYRRRRFHRELI